MKFNHIKALDYQANNTKVVVALTATTLEEITGLSTELLRVETDDGDLVEAFAGYRLASVTYDTATDTFSAIFEQGASDTTAATIAALTEALVAAETRSENLQTQLDEQADALIELAELLTEGTEV